MSQVGAARTCTSSGDTESLTRVYGWNHAGTRCSSRRRDKDEEGKKNTTRKREKKWRKKKRTEKKKRKMKKKKETKKRTHARRIKHRQVSERSFLMATAVILLSPSYGLFGCSHFFFGDLLSIYRAYQLGSGKRKANVIRPARNLGFKLQCCREAV